MSQALQSLTFSFFGNRYNSQRWLCPCRVLGATCGPLLDVNELQHRVTKMQSSDHAFSTLRA
jgi:hypothetical protein